MSALENLLRFRDCARRMRAVAAELALRQMHSAFANEPALKAHKCCPLAVMRWHVSSRLTATSTTTAAPSDEGIRHQVLLQINLNGELAMPLAFGFF
jgi:hypothetical protein